MWICQTFCKEKMIMIEHIPLTWSVMFGCGWAGFAKPFARKTQIICVKIKIVGRQKLTNFCMRAFAILEVSKSSNIAII
jgi:hypothetical protein